MANGAICALVRAQQSDRVVAGLLHWHVIQLTNVTTRHNQLCATWQPGHSQRRLGLFRAQIRAAQNRARCDTGNQQVLTTLQNRHESATRRNRKRDHLRFGNFEAFTGVTRKVNVIDQGATGDEQ